MRIVNQMPFTECEKCTKCIISVKHSVSEYGERVLYAGCKNSKKCMNQKNKGDKNDED